MLKKTLLVFVLIVTTISCKEDKKQEKMSSNLDIEVKNNDSILKNTFVVKLKGVFTKDDNFQLLYNENPEEGYNTKKIIRKKIKGSSKQQEIVYVIPKEIYPSKIRLDFGSNREQGTIEINKMTIIQDGQNLEISSQEFLSYFKPTQWINRIGISNESEFNLVVKNVDVNGRIVDYAPYFIASKKLIKALEVL